MRFVITMLVCLSAVAMAPTADAANLSSGGYTISSHQAGRSYSRNSVRYLTGQKPRQWGRSTSLLIPGHGHFEGDRAVIDEVRVRTALSLGRYWSGNLRGPARRSNDGFVFVFDYYDMDKYAIAFFLRFF